MSSPSLNVIFHALADPTRRAMLAALREGDQSVGELAAPHPISLMACSKHVRVLEQAGLIHRTVRGRTHVCRLRSAPLGVANAWLTEFERFWNQRLDALQALFKERRP